MNKSRLKSALWYYFDKIDNKHAECKICTSKVSCKTTITNLRRHLERKHPLDFRVSKSSGKTPTSSIFKDLEDGIIGDKDSNDDDSFKADKVREVSDMPTPIISRVHSPQTAKTYARTQPRNISYRLIEDYSQSPSNSVRRNRFNESSYQEDPSKIKDENEAFAQYVAVALNKLQPQQVILAQSEIQSVLTKYRLEAYSAQSNNSSMTNDSSNQSHPLYVVSNDQSFGMELTLQNTESDTSNTNGEALETSIKSLDD